MTITNPADASALQSILHRRSVSVLAGPEPTAAELEILLRAATTVPDHGQLRPYRFVVVPSEGRSRFGEALAAAALEARPDLAPGLVEKVRQKAFAAPLLIALIASPRAGAKIPEWEQLATAACTGYAIVLAAHALGLGAIWKTAAHVDGAALRATLGLSADERLLGWINLGRPEKPQPQEPRPSPDLASIASVLGPHTREPYLRRADEGR